jgi:hypothetical protein
MSSDSKCIIKLAYKVFGSNSMYIQNTSLKSNIVLYLPFLLPNTAFKPIIRNLH